MCALWVAEQDEVIESTLRLTASMRAADEAEEAYKERAMQETSFTALENKVGTPWQGKDPGGAGMVRNTNMQKGKE